MIDFPASPALNQTFNAANGAVYQWNGTVWVPVGVSSTLNASDTPPASPGSNQLWWNSALGQLFIWFNDGTSSQWVPASPTPTIRNQLYLYSEQVLAAPAADLRVNIPSNAKRVEIDFYVAPVATTDAFNFNELLGSVAQGGANHTTHYIFGLAPANSYNTSLQANGSSWNGFGGITIAWGRYTLMPFTGLQTTGTMQAEFVQTGGSMAPYIASIWGGVANPTGYRIAMAGNMNTGSYMRAYVVQ